VLPVKSRELIGLSLKNQEMLSPGFLMIETKTPLLLSS